MAEMMKIEVDNDGVVSYELNVKSSMDMMMGLVDAMSHSKELCNIVEASVEARKLLLETQVKGDTEVSKNQIDMFKNNKDE